MPHAAVDLPGALDAIQERWGKQAVDGGASTDQIEQSAGEWSEIFSVSD